MKEKFEMLGLGEGGGGMRLSQLKKPKIVAVKVFGRKLKFKVFAKR